MANHDNMGPENPGKKPENEEIKLWQPKKSEPKRKKSYIYEVPSADREPEVEADPDPVIWKPDKKGGRKHSAEMSKFQKTEGGMDTDSENGGQKPSGDSEAAQTHGGASQAHGGVSQTHGGVSQSYDGASQSHGGNASDGLKREGVHDWKQNIRIKKEDPDEAQELSPEERRKSLKKGMIRGSKNSISTLKRLMHALKSNGGKVFIALILLAVILGGLKFYNRIRHYRSFRTDWQVSATDSGYSNYLAIGDKILHYSQDGVNVLDLNGNILWDQAFNMDVPAVAVKGDYILIYDVKGKDYYICNTGGCTGNGTTEKKILKGDISSKGVACLVLDDKKCNYIDYFRKDGSQIDLEIKTLITGDGYPLDIAISPDGVELMTSYIYASGGKMLSEVVFRNFEEGKNDADRVVGGFRDYEEILVPEVTFFDDQSSAAVTENSIDFYSTKNALKPELVKHEPFTEAIRSVASDESYLAVILEAASEKTDGAAADAGQSADATDGESSQDSKSDQGSKDSKAAKDSKKKSSGSEQKESEASAETQMKALEYAYQLKVFDKNGKSVFDETVDFPYTNMAFSGDGLFVFNKDTCAMYEMTGVCKYKGSLNVEIDGLMRFGDKTLVVYGNGALQKVTLK